jgi:pyruvate kinase
LQRSRNTKIVATLGPSSSTPEKIRALAEEGADVFRLNLSHGSHDDHRKIHGIIRAVEQEISRPLGVLADLQGPKIRIGNFSSGSVHLASGQPFRLDLDEANGNINRVSLPHPEVLTVLSEGDAVLLNDGKIRLEVTKGDAKGVDCTVIVGGDLSDHKGVNIPGVVLPLQALTPKDLIDLPFVLDLGVDWIGLSFVQRAENVAEVRKHVAGRAGLMAKIEKPSAIDELDHIIELADGIMVARGDLGVEVPVEEVPGLQKKIVRAARAAGKPVVVATQMLESMITAPVPTRAEVSDVATAVYDGADAVMLSAESAAGEYPIESVAMMNRVVEQAEHDPQYRTLIEASPTPPEANAADAISAAAKQVAETLGAVAIVTYTTTGSTTLRAARQRPTVPILALTPIMATARRLSILWGVHCIPTNDPRDFGEMVERAGFQAHEEGFAEYGERLVITAGVPFGTPGATNVLRISVVRK